jgi:hypothetical protein
MSGPLPPDQPAREIVRSPPPLRLGIGHLMLWMTTCGLVLTGYNVLNDPRDFTPAEWAFSSVFQLVMSLGYSLALTAVIVLLARRTQGDRRFPTQAGHWLAIMGVITLAIDGGSLAAVKLYAAWRGIPWSNYWNTYQAAAWGLGTMIGLLLLVGVRQEWRWRAVVAGIVAFTGLHAVVYALAVGGVYIHWMLDAFEMCTLAILILGMATIAWAAYGDLSEHAGRDWLHWGGAAAWISLAAMQAAGILYRWWIA